MVRRTGILCLNPEDPGWDNARGYLFDESTATLYFPVSKRYLPERLEDFRVLIRSEPRVLVTGDLLPATSDDDFTTQLSLAEGSGMGLEKARYAAGPAKQATEALSLQAIHPRAFGDRRVAPG